MPDDQWTGRWSGSWDRPRGRGRVGPTCVEFLRSCLGRHVNDDLNRQRLRHAAGQQLADGGRPGVLILRVPNPDARARQSRNPPGDWLPAATGVGRGVMAGGGDLRFEPGVGRVVFLRLPCPGDSGCGNRQLVARPEQADLHPLSVDVGRGVPLVLPRSRTKTSILVCVMQQCWREIPTAIRPCVALGMTGPTTTMARGPARSRTLVSATRTHWHFRVPWTESSGSHGFDRLTSGISYSSPPAARERLERNPKIAREERLRTEIRVAGGSAMDPTLAFEAIPDQWLH